MADLLARLAPTTWLRMPRPTARLRLTLLYGMLFLVSGAAVLAVTYLLAWHITAPSKAQNAAFGDQSTTSSRAPQHPPATGDRVIRLTNAERARLQAQILHEHDAAMHRLLAWSGLTLAGMAVVSIALGWLVAGRVLRPVRTINATAQRISANNLHERINADGPDDEFRELAATLDDLLERLQASFESQRRFVASASHELRTPLTLDRALLERALRSAGPSNTMWRGTCERLLVSNEQQHRLIDALLALARSEGALRRERFELGPVIDSVLLTPELDAAAKGLRMRTRISQAPINGDPRLVERLVRNLVDNAVRYNSPDGHVDIAATTRCSRAILTVTNTGPTVPAADIDRLFQPFQRLEPNRTSHADGTGLGLSIVKAIAEAHNASVTTIPRPQGGLEVKVSFPACPQHEEVLPG